MPVKGSDLEEDFSGSAQGCEAVQTKGFDRDSCVCSLFDRTSFSKRYKLLIIFTTKRILKLDSINSDEDEAHSKWYTRKHRHIEGDRFARCSAKPEEHKQI